MCIQEISIVHAAKRKKLLTHPRHVCDGDLLGVLGTAASPRVGPLGRLGPEVDEEAGQLRPRGAPDEGNALGPAFLVEVESSLRRGKRRES